MADISVKLIHTLDRIGYFEDSRQVTIQCNKLNLLQWSDLIHFNLCRYLIMPMQKKVDFIYGVALKELLNDF